MFNEVSALDNGPNPITAVANQDSLIWRPGYRLFRKLLAVVWKHSVIKIWFCVTHTKLKFWILSGWSGSPRWIWII